MKTNLMRLALATTLAIGLSACADDAAEQQGGGGGGGQGSMAQQQARKDAAENRRPNDMGDQFRANVTTDLMAEGRDFAEAYARMPWVHANIAAEDWERALDDLQFVMKQVDDLSGDKDVGAPLKAKIASVRPQLAALSRQIQAHDMTANATAAAVTQRFAALTNDPLMNAWLGDRPHGGGAGQ